MKRLFLLLSAAVSLSAQAPSAGPAATAVHGRVVTDTLWSQSLGAHKALTVYLPPSYASQPARRFPVAYYLHGVGGNETNWNTLGHMGATMDSLTVAGMPQMIVVMPDGDDGWYTTWNSLADQAACRRNAPKDERAETYCVAWPHYDDYIARDVVQFTDRKFRTLATREHRAIAGNSMGGYGAIMLAVEYPDVFRAAASHSGALKPFTPGPVFGRDTAAWAARDPAVRLARLVAKRGVAAAPALFLDCGTEDSLVSASRTFRTKAAAIGVVVMYHEWGGGHTWGYWRSHVAESLSWIGHRVAGGE